MRKEYALEVRTKEEESHFLYQIDVFRFLVNAEIAMDDYKNILKEDEQFDIRCIEYDDDDNEISCYSVF